MNQQINELSSKNEELEKQLSSTIEEKSSLNDKINSLETEKTDLENKVKELSTDETNPRIVQLLDENAKLKEKLSNLKQSVIQIKERLDNDIYNKLELKTKLLKETLQINEQLQKKIEALQAENEKSKATEDQLKIYRDKYNSLVKDKVEMENFSAHQEQTIKNLESEIYNEIKNNISQYIVNKISKEEIMDKIFSEVAVPRKSLLKKSYIPEFNSASSKPLGDNGMNGKIPLSAFGKVEPEIEIPISKTQPTMAEAYKNVLLQTAKSIEENIKIPSKDDTNIKKPTKVVSVIYP